jgi:dolichol-phosphate mannosyltransferase
MNFAQQEQVAVVVPVFNEEDNILPLAREVAETMAAANQPYELIFVDDASTDSTWEKINEAQELGNVRGMRLNHRTGQSGALWAGIQATDSSVIATLDGDLQNDPHDLPKLLQELDECDFVCGVRATRCDNWLRRVSTKVARAARKFVLKVDFTDTGCACRAFKRTSIDGLFPFDGLHRFLPVLVHANGAKTRQIPISHRPRTAGRSKYGLFNRLGRGIYDLIAVAWWQRRRIPRVEFISLAPRLAAHS